MLGLQKLPTFPGLETSSDSPSLTVGFGPDQAALQFIQVTHDGIHTALSVVTLLSLPACLMGGRRVTELMGVLRLCVCGDQVKDGQAVDHAKSSGRIAFACTSVPPIYERVKATGDAVQTPPLTLPTPGKVRATDLPDPSTRPALRPETVVNADNSQQRATWQCL